MAKKKDPFLLSDWNEGDRNYELEFLRLENHKLKEELDQFKSNTKVDMTMEKDIAALVRISMRMKELLEACRSSVMLPLNLGKEINRVIKEIENYG